MLNRTKQIFEETFNQKVANILLFFSTKTKDLLT